ncbi:MAG: hypothetical protein IPL28_25325 [Chloroflexi bacterium]|nr:hypothetical protein [Chloroflexota bacterium]
MQTRYEVERQERQAEIYRLKTEELEDCGRPHGPIWPPRTLGFIGS